jgi:hypothetical protein
MNKTYLKDIRHEIFPNESIHEWDYLQVEATPHKARVYFKPAKESGDGFYFYAVSHDGYVCDKETENNEWHQDYCIVECILNGISYFDGIRHLYYGDKITDNFGYHYYPSLSLISKVMESLARLEAKYCSDLD